MNLSEDNWQSIISYLDIFIYKNVRLVNKKAGRAFNKTTQAFISKRGLLMTLYQATTCPMCFRKLLGCEYCDRVTCANCDYFQVCDDCNNTICNNCLHAHDPYIDICDNDACNIARRHKNIYYPQCNTRLDVTSCRNCNKFCETCQTHACKITQYNCKTCGKMLYCETCKPPTHKEFCDDCS